MTAFGGKRDGRLSSSVLGIADRHEAKGAAQCLPDVPVQVVLAPTARNEAITAFLGPVLPEKLDCARVIE